MAVLFALPAVVVSSSAQEIGKCEPGLAESFLDVNNVRARILNNGGLFWRGDPHVYEVPKGQGLSSIFAAGIWIGGQVEGQLRLAASTYGPWEFWPGPLDDDGRLPDPSDCSEYDRIHSLTVWDIRAYEETGIATQDLLDWPVHIGAPVTDGNGDGDDYNFAEGDRPNLTGHLARWWIMNDLGNEHGRTNSNPLGVEVRASAFAFASDDPALDQATFYRYTIRNPQDYSLDSAYVGFWIDADLGNFNDDFVGYDTTLGLAYIYNADNDDERYYGTPPPAVGADIIMGPIRYAVEHEDDGDGFSDDQGEPVPVSSFMSYYGSGSVMGDPQSADEYYQYMQSRWRDGRKATEGWNARDSSDTPVDFLFPGDPVNGSYWSQINADGEGTPLYFADRRILISAGPTTISPQDEITFFAAIVWARGEDHLDSVAELRAASATVQSMWDSGSLIDLPAAPIPSDEPQLIRPADGADRQPSRLTLQWQSVPDAEAYLIEVASDPDFEERVVTNIVSDTTSLVVSHLPDSAEISWRVRGVSSSGVGPVSESQRFGTTTYDYPDGDVLTLSDGSPAFLEIAGPSGSDPCEPVAFGCAEAGGRFIYPGTNSTDDFIMYSVGGPGPEESLRGFAPHDYEIRFTEQGSYAYSPFAAGEILHVPFEIWDIGMNGPGPNDPSDDAQLIPETLSDSGGTCDWGYGELDGSVVNLDWPGTDRIYARYPEDSYAEWESSVEPLVDASPDGCPHAGDFNLDISRFFRSDLGNVLQRIVFFGNPEGPNYRPEGPPEGTVVRLLTSSLLTPPAPAAPGRRSDPQTQPFTFWWTKGGGAATEIQVARNPTFAGVEFEATTLDDHVVVSGLEEDRTYYWRLRSSNGVFAVSGWSDVWSFTAGEVTNVASERTAEVPHDLHLDQNYPNPFNPSTTIRFGLPRSEHATIVVYDVLGRRVAILLDEVREAGWHEATWNAAETASGIYMYEVATESQRRVRSMLLVR